MGRRGDRVSAVSSQAANGEETPLSQDRVRQSLGLAVELQIDQLRRDGGTQPRAKLSEDVITEYADEMQNGSKFPPVIVFYDGSDYWLADGFHRVGAAERNDYKGISADIRQGTLRDAILFSVGVNATHGLRRTNEDKRRAVMAMLGDDEWREWSNVKIAEKCRVSESYVRNLRNAHFAQNEVTDRTFVTKHGTVAKMRTKNIGKPKAAQQVPEADPVTASETESDDPQTDKQLTIAGWLIENLRKAASHARSLEYGDYARDLERDANSIAQEWGLDQ